MKRPNIKAIYYTPPGSYDGLVRIQGKWIRVNELNRINKTGWVRWQGPPSKTMQRALKEQPRTEVFDFLFHKHPAQTTKNA